MSIASPAESLDLLGARDAALARLDVLPTVDGIEPGTWEVARLASNGVTVLNELRTLLATHDKLLTSRVLAAHNVFPIRARTTSPSPARRCHSSPRSSSSRASAAGAATSFSASTKPARARSSSAWPIEHGSGGRERSSRSSFRRQAATFGSWSRPELVGAIQRVAAPGEWRTNVALGGVRRPVSRPPAARELAVAAAAAAKADLVGVDLLPAPDGSWVVIELNGAVEFTDEYSLDRDVFAAASSAPSQRLRTAARADCRPRVGHNPSLTASSPRRRPRPAGSTRHSVRIWLASPADCGRH